VLRGEDDDLVLSRIALAITLLAGARGARAQEQVAPAAGDLGFIAEFLPSHARVRRDTFDDPNWSGGDSFMKGIAKAEAGDCAVALYTHGTGQDFKIQIDFRHQITVTRRSTPETIVLDGDDQAIHYWPIAWDHATPKVTPGDPTALPSLLLGLSNADAGVRLASASGHALEACGGGPRR